MPRTATDTGQLTDDLFGFVSYLQHSAHDAFFEVASELDLSLSQLRALFLVAEHGELALHELVPLLGLSPQATGRAADVLVRAGLASRREDDRDRRVKRVALTDEGTRTVRRFDAARRDGLREFVGTLADEERDHLAAALEPLVARPEIQAMTAGLDR